VTTFSDFLNNSKEFLQKVAGIQRKKLFLQSVITINLYNDMKIIVANFIIIIHSTPL